MSNNKIEFYQVGVHPKRLSGSPFVIATELFLKHKNLEWDANILTYDEVRGTVGRVTNGKWSFVPTLKFPNGDVTFDSLKIADYLDEKYPENPLNPHNKELDELMEYCDKTINFMAFRLCVMDAFNYMDEASKKYFRESKEPIFHAKLEELAGNKEENIAIYYETLKPVIERLEKSNFIDGDKPLIHDYLTIAKIQMVRTGSPQIYKELVNNNPSEIFKNWVERMNNLFDGFLNNRKTILSE